MKYVFMLLIRFLDKAPFLGFLIRFLMNYFFMLLIRFLDKVPFIRFLKSFPLKVFLIPSLTPVLWFSFLSSLVIIVVLSL